MSGEPLDVVMASLVAWDGTRPLERHDLTTAELLDGARRHRLTGVLAAALARGAIVPVDGDTSAVRHELIDRMAEVLLLEDVLLETIEMLERGEVDYRVLKGSALAHTVHVDPSQRSFGDTDLLVPASRLDHVVRILADEGARRPAPPLSRDFDRRFAKSVTLRWRRGTELDLHRTLAPGPFGLRIVLDDLWAEPCSFELAGRPVRTLGPELHLLNAVYHVALGDSEPPYGSVRDLALLVHAGVDHDRVVELATRWRGEAVIVEAVRRLRALGVGAGALGAWADRQRVSDRDRRALATYRTREGRFRRQALVSLRELGWLDRLAYGRAVAFRPRRR